MNYSDTQKQIRATFNDTKKAQEKLRSELDCLEKSNSYVTDRRGFFNLLADSLLGLDSEKSCRIFLKDNTVLRIDNMGKFVRELSYLKDSDYSFLKKYGKVNCSNDIDIGHIWHELKFELFGVFPEALAMSVRISKERELYESDVEATSYDEVRKK